MNPAAIIPFLPATYQPLANGVLGVVGASYALVMGLDKLIQIGHAIWPNVKALTVLEDVFGDIASRWPQALKPAATPDAVKTPVPK
jgi:hypothetical protein